MICNHVNMKLYYGFQVNDSEDMRRFTTESMDIADLQDGLDDLKLKQDDKHSKNNTSIRTPEGEELLVLKCCFDNSERESFRVGFLIKDINPDSEISDELFFLAKNEITLMNNLYPEKINKMTFFIYHDCTSFLNMNSTNCNNS